MQVPQCINKKECVISVWLDENKDDEKTLKKFHCPVCGKVMFEYYNRLRMIVPGKNESSEGVVVECRGVVKEYDEVSKQLKNTKCRTRICVQ